MLGLTPTQTPFALGLGKTTTLNMGDLQSAPNLGVNQISCI